MHYKIFDMYLQTHIHTHTHTKAYSFTGMANRLYMMDAMDLTGDKNFLMRHFSLERGWEHGVGKAFGNRRGERV